MDKDQKPHLYMVLLGCRPPGRFTEQHDIFFGIGTSLEAIVPDLINSWPEAHGKIHIDAWRKVVAVNGYEIAVVPAGTEIQEDKLFFINLGGYQPGYFAEPHYMMVLVAKSKAEAIKQSKETAFYKEMGFTGATSHIDDKYGVDIDDIYELDEILDPDIKRLYSLKLTPVSGGAEDPIHLGYLPLSKIKKLGGG